MLLAVCWVLTQNPQMCGNLTMNALGRMLGFDPKSADVRISQYEKDAKMPKEELIHSMADVLGISPMALKVPNIDSYDALMHTLFALEDIYGLTVSEEDGKVSLYGERRDLAGSVR